MIKSKIKTISIYGSLGIMLLVIGREIVLPFVMGAFQQNKQLALLSDLGAPGMPMQHAFKSWEDLDGLLFILGTPFYYFYLKPISQKLALLVTILIITYGIGDCLFTGIFDYSGNYFANLHSFLHAFGSIIGCSALFCANCLLLLAELYYGRTGLARLIGLIQIVAAGACFACVLLENIWPLLASILQIVGLNSLYLPLVLVALIQLVLTRNH